jgi:hypothetical protein
LENILQAFYSLNENTATPLLLTKIYQEAHEKNLKIFSQFDTERNKYLFRGGRRFRRRQSFDYCFGKLVFSQIPRL